MANPARIAIHPGRCHCGAIGFEYRTALPPGQWSVRACQCAFCRAHDALSTSDPRGGLAFHEHEPGFLQRYRFGGRTADFMICGRCGVYIGATMQDEGVRFGIINIHALQSLPAGLPAPTPMNYDGEAAGSRRDRRRARWTPMAHDASSSTGEGDNG